MLGAGRTTTTGVAGAPGVGAADEPAGALGARAGGDAAGAGGGGDDGGGALIAGGALRGWFDAGG